MGIYFQRAQEQATPGETTTLGFVCHNETSRLVTSAFRVEVSDWPLGIVRTHVDGPGRLACREEAPGHG